jgi:hypothetical protein
MRCATFPRMSATTPNRPAPVRTFNTNTPIKSCRLRREDLGRLYKIINDRQSEYGQFVVNSILAQQPNESAEEFVARQSRVLNAFVTTVNITGTNNEVVSGNGEHFLSSENIADNLLTVFFTTIAGPNVLGFTPQNRATLMLDFSRPTILDFTKLPTWPTPNTSHFEISAVSEPWFTTLNTRLKELFDDRRTGLNWLHQTGVMICFCSLSACRFPCGFLIGSVPASKK